MHRQRGGGSQGGRRCLSPVCRVGRDPTFLEVSSTHYCQLNTLINITSCAFRSLLPYLRFLTADPSDLVREKSVGACLAVARRLKDLVTSGPAAFCSSPEEEQPCRPLVSSSSRQVHSKPKRLVKVKFGFGCSIRSSEQNILCW